MLRRGFDLNKKIIGRGGENTRGIYDATAAKIRLRGRGSGHRETTTGREANAPLMLAITGERGQEDNFCVAVRKSVELLAEVERRWATFLASPRGGGWGERVDHGSTYWVGEISPEAAVYLAETLDALELALPFSAGSQSPAPSSAGKVGKSRRRR